MIRVVYILGVLLILSSCSATKNTAKGGNKLSNRDQLKVEKLMIDGATEKAIGNFNEAEIIFTAALEIDKNNGAAYFELSGINDYKKNSQLAIEQARKASTINPGNEWYQTNLAVLLQKYGQFEEAIDVYGHLVEQFPKRSEYLFTLSDNYLQVGKIEEALRTYERIEEELGPSPELLLHKHQLYVETKQLDKAEKELEKLIELDPREIRYRAILAEYYQGTGRDKEAHEIFLQLIKEDPNNGQVHLALSDYYHFHGNEDKSFEHLKLAFAQRDLELDIKMQIILRHYTNSERNETIKVKGYELIDILSKTHPEDAKVHAIYGDFLNRDSRYEEALRSFKKAAELDPTKFPIWSQVVFLESDLKQFDELEKDAATGMELFPAQPTFYFFHGIACIRLKKYKEAISSLSAGKEYVIDNQLLLAEFYQYLGDAHHAVNAHEESDNSYEKSLKFNPSNPYVLNNFAYYLSLRNMSLEKAEEMSFRANELAPNTPSFLDTYGWILFQRGKFLDAEVWLHKALVNGGETNGTILEHYGDVLIHLDKEADAIDYWIRARETGEGSDILDKKIAAKKYLEQ